MALTRVYCGLSATDMASWLSVAVVDDAGRLLDLCELSDDPAGYARLGALLAERSTAAAPVAADRGDHLIGQLLAAANRPIAIADQDSVADFSERFCDDESPDERESPPSQRRAVGLARALQAGALSAIAQSPAWELDDFKPVLAAHAAVTAGRQAAAVALREVLRELYPAALRAYPDPAECVPLKILDVLPEPGMISTSPAAGGRDASLVAELSGSGVADPTTAVAAITALRVAAQETPRRNTHRMLGPVVAETVRQAVAAVRACDAASAALVATLVERLGTSTLEPQRPRLVPVAPVSPAPRRTFGPAAEVPASRVAPRERTPSAAASGVTATPGGPMPFAAPPAPFAPTAPAEPFAPAAHLGPAAHPNPAAHLGPAGTAYAPAGTPVTPVTPIPPAAPPFVPISPAAAAPGYQMPAVPTPREPSSPAAQAPHSFRGAESRGNWPLNSPTDSDFAVRSTTDHTPASTPSFQDDPLTAPLPSSPVAPVSPSRVPPPWLGEDMPYEPPALRLVESPRPAPDLTVGDPLTDPLPPDSDPFEGLRFEPPVLRVIDGEGNGRPRRAGGGDTAPAAHDGDLLIFSETRSAWFTEVDEYAFADDDTASWGRLSDEGWRAAEQLARPAVGADTMAGLPRRVPQANLVPGAPQPQPRQLRIVRDPESIAAHTTGYFRGWRRGQEIGGFAVGQRDRAAWEFNRDQRAREASREMPDAAARLL